MSGFPLVHSSAWSLLLHWLLVTLLLLSYIPQYRLLRTRRNTNGISPYLVFLRSMSATGTLAASLSDFVSTELLDACITQTEGVSTAGQCLMQMTDHWQLAADWIGAQGFLFLYLYYCFPNALRRRPRDIQLQTDDTPLAQLNPQGVLAAEENEDEEEEIITANQPQPPSRILIIIITIISPAFYSVFIPAAFFFILGHKPTNLTYFFLFACWRVAMVLFSALCSATCYLPILYRFIKLILQARKTGKVKRAGEGRLQSLSVWTTGIQSITYSLVFLAHLVRYWYLDPEQEHDLRYFLRLYIGLSLVWVNLVLVAWQQGLLLGLWGYYHLRYCHPFAARKGNAKSALRIIRAGLDDGDEEDIDGGTDGRTPLLPEDQKG